MEAFVGSRAFFDQPTMIRFSVKVNDKISSQTGKVGLNSQANVRYSPL